MTQAPRSIKHSLPPQTGHLGASSGSAQLAIGALGVVFGDIGTSPLYAMSEIFFAHKDVALGEANVIGSVSLVVWALIAVVTIKYLSFVLKADNEGQGGVFALYGLLHRLHHRSVKPLLLVLLLAAGLLFGDGIITPAISVLSAVEGLKVAAPTLAPFIIPLTVAILTGLFWLQRQGTTKVGKAFGPVIIVWFITIAILGLIQVIDHPLILAALNPVHGAKFLLRAGWHVDLLVLGGVMLAITGGEALYADMGHFGPQPIRRAWFAVVFPALILNYLGQGAYLLSGLPVQSSNIFYSLVPQSMLIPVIILATMATIIASQALISGAFSLAAQATALGLFPRLKIVHTHDQHEGQVYAPFVNWSLYVGCVLLVLYFGSSTALASAYGLAVSGDMLATSIAMILLARYHWRWPLPAAVLLFGSFACLDLGFLAATSLKFLEGGYIPLSIGVGLFTIMATWQWGRHATFAGYSSVKTMSIAELLEKKREAVTLMQRNVILMVPRPIRADSRNTPALLQLFWNRYGLLPENLIFVEVVHRKVPYLHQDRYQVTTLQRDDGKGSIISVSINFGFMEEPNVEHVLASLASHQEINLPPDPRHWQVHVSQENLIPSPLLGPIARTRHRLFALLRKLSRPGHYYYGLGDAVQLTVEIMPVKLQSQRLAVKELV